MMYRVYYKLNVDFDFLKDPNFPFAHTEPIDTEWLVKTVSTDTLSDEMRQFAVDHNFNIHSYKGADSYMFFRGGPERDLTIHMDRGPRWGINYICGAPDSEMIWYGFKDGVTRADGFELPTTDRAASYLCFKDDQVEEIDRAKLDGLYLVRIDLPHAIRNYDKDNFRYCLAVKDLNNRWSWEETVENFKDYITI